MSAAKKTSKKTKREPTKLSKNSTQVVGALAVMLAFALERSTAKQKKSMMKKFEGALKQVRKATEAVKVVDEMHLIQMAAAFMTYVGTVVTDTTVGFCSGRKASSKIECETKGGVWNGKPIDIFELFDRPFFIPDIRYQG